MRSTITSLVLIIVSCLILKTGSINAQTCSDAGTASAISDSVCFGDTTSLILTGYIGAIQWQSFDGSSWIDETGTGSTSDSYNITVMTTTDFRSVVTATGCLPDTSNTITINVGINPPTTTNATRCGYGQVTLTATGTGSTIKWYDVASGGTALATGSSYTPNVAATTTFYAAAVSNGGGAAAAPMTTHSTVYTGYTRGYWFTAPSNFTITSLYVPTEASTANQSIAVLMYPPGPPPPAGTVVMGFTTLYMTQNNTTSGPISVNIPVQVGQHIAIIGNRGSDPVSNFAAINSYDSGAAFNTTIDGNTVALNRAGMQSNLTGFDPASTGLLIVAAAGQRGRIIFNYETGCESGRTPAIATVNPSDPATISAADSALCSGQSTTLTVNSINGNYTYTWSPPAGLSGTTGTVVTANPTTPTVYTVVADDGVCGYIDSLFIDVGPASVAGTASASSDTICAGNDLYLNLTGSVGNVLWQSFNGTAWVNESGPGFDSTTYITTPLADITYRAIITSGGCDPDTSLTLDITVLNIQDPILSDTTICGGGNISLTALGQGNFNWFNDSTSTSPFFTGATYSYNATATDTFWVEAFGGADYNVGPTNPGIGSQTTGTSNDLGCAFDVTTGCTLTSVKVFPQAAGPLTVNLRLVQNGPILASYTANVAQFIGQELPLNFTIPPGNGYRLELAAGSVACSRNTNGAAYPYQATNSPLSITGYYSPNFGTGTAYYWFYDWKVSEGCKSNKVPVVVTVNPFPATPNIGQLGNTLVSSAPSGNQWILNGSILAGQTGQSLNLTQTGTYTVAVTVNGCTSLSPPFNVITIGLNEIDGIGFNVFPNPVSDVLILNSSAPMRTSGSITIYDIAGRRMNSHTPYESGEMLNEKIDVSKLGPGVYILEIASINGKANVRFQVDR